MKILWIAPLGFITKESINKQAGTWVISLARALVASNLELKIISLSRDQDNDVIEMQLENIEFVFIKVPSIKLDVLTFNILKIKRVKKYLKGIIDDYDILHIHGTEQQYQAMAHGLKIPKIISIQGIISEYIKVMPLDLKKYILWKIKSYYEKKHIALDNNYSCRTHWDSKFIKSHNQSSNIFMIWEIIREDFFYDNFSLKKENILFVGGKNPIKGLKELLVAYNNSIQSLGYKLIVLGDCTLDDIQKFIKAKNLTNIQIENITCRGRVDSKEMVKAYKESYCLAHPTYIDNSPNSICEAQLSGLPVIASDVGGVSSLIENNKTGLLIDNSPHAIELAVKKLHFDTSLRNTISKNSRQVARKRHDVEEIVHQTLNMYEKVISSYN